MILTGISCSEEMFIIRNVHISLLATPNLRGGPKARPLRRSSSNFASSSMALSPAGVAAQPSPRTFAIIFVEMCFSAG